MIYTKPSVFASPLWLASALTISTAAAQTIPGNAVNAIDTPDQVQSLTPVIIQGTNNSAITEGTGSYAPGLLHIGRLSGGLRETPQSVSVVTRQQMDDQNVTQLVQALRYTTGLLAKETAPGVVNIESRGYSVDRYLIDGFSTRGGQGMWGAQYLDMSFFDHVEAWRGPSGVLQGAGEPGGTINLVRKRALAETRLGAAATVGSWDRYRGEIDLTGALTEDARLRGRLVAFHERANSFIDYDFRRLSGAYGTIEYDLSSRTTLSLGLAYQRGKSMVNVGLPLMADGSQLDLPRSTFIGSADGIKDDDSYRYFAELEHYLDNGGRVVAAMSQYRRNSDLQRFMSQSTIDPVTGDFTLRATHQMSDQRDTGMNMYLDLPWDWLGHEQQVIAGIDHHVYKGGFAQAKNTDYKTNINDLRYDWPLPIQVSTAIPGTRTIETGAYAQSRIRLSPRWSSTLGGRMTWWRTEDPDDPSVDQRISAKFVPYAAIMYDFDQYHSGYVSYSRIFTPQTDITVNGDFLSPRTGRQVEIGLKGEYFNGRLNAHIAAFRINDTNRAIADPDNADYSIAAGEVRSQGFEAQVEGELSPGWNISAGYAYTQTEYLQAPRNQLGQTFNTNFPRHNFSLWTNYRLPDSLSAWQVGGGIRAASGGSLDSGGMHWEGPGYGVASLQIGYHLPVGGDLMLTVDNIFDKTFFERYPAQNNRQNRYGAPRSFTLFWRMPL